MAFFSAPVEHHIASGSEEFHSIRCDLGIDLFVDLQIDPTESTQVVDDLSSRASSDCRNDLPCAINPPAYKGISQDVSQPGSWTHEEPLLTSVSCGELDGYVRVAGQARREESLHVAQAGTNRDQNRRKGRQSRQVEDCQSVDTEGGGQGVVANFVSRLAAQRYDLQRMNYSAQTSIEDQQVQERSDHPGERSGDVVQEAFEDARKDSEARHFFCSENRRWSPRVEDYDGMLIDMNREPDDQETRYNEGGIDLGVELIPGHFQVPSCLPEDLVEGQGHVEDAADSCLEHLSPDQSPDIRSYGEAEIAAAFQLVHMSAHHYRNQLSQQLNLSAVEGTEEYDLGFRVVSDEGIIAQIAEAPYVASPQIEFPSGEGQMEISLWSDDNRYIPGLARRAKRLSKRPKLIVYRNPETEEGNDCDILPEPPRKLTYGTTRALVSRHRPHFKSDLCKVSRRCICL